MPSIGGGVSREESFSPVVGGGLVHNNNCLVLRLQDSPAHYWVLRQHLLRVVAPSWWWGVVFVYWIVVASI